MKTKKILAAVCSAILVVVLAFAFAGCDKSGDVKKAFENAGYTVSSVSGADSAALKAWLSEDEQKNIAQYEVITCTKVDLTNPLNSGAVVIYKCPSADKIKEVLGEDGYKNAQDKGWVNGNCFLAVPLSANALEIFKNA